MGRVIRDKIFGFSMRTIMKLSDTELKRRRKIMVKKPEYKAKEASRVHRKRLETLSVLSKRMSNSDIPCCNCCGEDGTDFLDLDHIQGRIPMDNIKEITDIGYSSVKLYDFSSVARWLKKHDYLSDLSKDYFQVLCKNCNCAKAMPKNNMICPHKHKDKNTINSIYIERRSWVKGNGYYKDGNKRAGVEHSPNLPMPEPPKIVMECVGKDGKMVLNWRTSIKCQTGQDVGVDLAVGDMK